MDNLDSRGIEMWLTVEAAPAVLAKSNYPLQHLHSHSLIIKNTHNTCDCPLDPPPQLVPQAQLCGHHSGSVYPSSVFRVMLGNLINAAVHSDHWSSDEESS